ncbi:MAG: MG2 domain-containing protein, partial [Phycisphaeraceae bacterium]|nr:MG2 domain-containing protein [Phycisphaeraceae bacterium]
MIDPTSIDDQIDAYLHDLLSPDQKAEIERKVSDDPTWRQALQHGRERLGRLENLPPAEASASLINQTLGRIDALPARTAPRRRKVLTYLPLALAAGLLAMIGGHLFLENLEPTGLNLSMRGPTHWQPDAPGSVRIRLVNEKTGRPIEGARVRLTLVGNHREQKNLGDLVTGPNGSVQPNFHMPDWPDGTYRIRLVAQTEDHREVLIHPIHLNRSWKLMLSSDKPLYQPSQTIHLRALALANQTRKPADGREAVFEVRDPKGTLIFRKTVRTSRFGIASVDCPLADEILLGVYRIQCRLGDTTSQRAVTVKRYVLPKLKVAAVPDRPWYQPGQTIRVAVQSDYFFGKPVVGGRVEAELHIDHPSFDRTIQAPEVRTNAQGSAAVEIRLPDRMAGSPQHGGDAAVRLKVRVTDTAGQSHQTEVRRRVSNQPLKITAIAESGGLVAGLRNRIHLFVRYPDGQPAGRTRLNINDGRHEATTNALGIVSLELTPSESPLVLDIQATDPQGVTSRKQVHLRPSRRDQDFILQTDRPTYEGGQSVQLTAWGHGRQPLFLDWIQNGQTLLTETIDMSEGKGRLTVDLPAHLSGMVQIVGYRFVNSQTAESRFPSTGT